MEKDLIAKYEALLNKYNTKEHNRLIIEQSINKKINILKKDRANLKSEINTLNNELENIKTNEKNIRILDSYLIKGLLCGLPLAFIYLFLRQNTFAAPYLLKELILTISLVFIPIGISIHLFTKKYPHTKLYLYRDIASYQQTLTQELSTKTALLKNNSQKLKVAEHELKRVHSYQIYKEAENYLNIIINYLTSPNFIFDSSYFIISDKLEKDPNNITPLENKAKTLKLVKHDQKEEYI